MEISKKDLLRQLQEQHQLNVDEMAKKGDFGYETKGRSEDDIIRAHDGRTIGFKMMDYSNSQNPIKIPILMTCGGEDGVNQILQENQELIQQIKAQFGDVPIRWSNEKTDPCTLKYAPRRKKFPLQPLPGEEGGEHIAHTLPPRQGARSADDAAVRTMNEQIYDFLSVPEMDEFLNKCSIPSIKSKETTETSQTRDMRSHLKRENVVDLSTGNIDWKTHNYHTYTNPGKFLKAVQQRITGKDVDVEFTERSLARQYVTRSSAWNETKPLNQMYYGGKMTPQGKTPIYDLNAYGLSLEDTDVTVRSDFNVKGTNNPYNHTYTWNLLFIVKFGNALTDQFQYGKLKVNKEIPVTIEVEYPQDVELNENKTALDVRVIFEAFRQALEQMREKLLTELKPIQALSMTRIGQSQIAAPQPEQGQVNEAIVDKIMKKLMKDSEESPDTKNTRQ